MPGYFLVLLGSGFTLWMAVECVRRGQAGSWLWIILMFGPVGAAVYFFTEYADLPTRRFVFQTRRVTAQEIRHAEVEVRRLDSGYAWWHYASLLRAKGDFTRAIAAAEKALERTPDHLETQYELGQSLLGVGRHAEAADVLERVVARDRMHDSDQALYALARARLLSGQAEAARPLLAELEARSSRPSILFDRATLEAQLGEREVAARCFQRIVTESEYVPAYLRREVKPWVKKARQALRKLEG